VKHKRAVPAICGAMAVAALLSAAPTQAAPPNKAPKTISFSGAGGAVPDGNPSGASFDIPVPDPGLVLPTGNNVTVTLNGVQTNDLYGPSDFWYPFGGLVDFTATLQHVGDGSPQFLFANVLNGSSFVCLAGLNGTYTFSSGEPTTLRSQCGTGDVFHQPRLIPPGTYLTTNPDDVTDSHLSSAWNSHPVAGTWRLHVTDTNVNTGPGQFEMNKTWTWTVDIQVAGMDSCKQGGWTSFGLFKNQGDCVSYFATGGKNAPSGSTNAPSGGKKPPAASSHPAKLKSHKRRRRRRGR
jgi:hypothetical protein